MQVLAVELPTGADEWGEFSGRQLDAKVRELDIAHRRIEAAVINHHCG